MNNGENVDIGISACAGTGTNANAKVKANANPITDTDINADNYVVKKINVNLNGVEQGIISDVIEESLNLYSMEKKLIIKVLNLNSGNITMSAKVLGIGRNTLYRKMETYGIRHMQVTAL